VTEFVRAAGGIVLRHGQAGIELLLVHRTRYEDWSLPKGKLEPGESWPAAALREVEEETGLRCLLGRELGHSDYADAKGRPKRARYWAMVAPGAEATAANEVDAVRWAGFAEAAERLSYDRDRRFVALLAAGPDEGEVHLVRHALAADRRTWERPDEERPLTSEGRRQADALVPLFRNLGFDALASSRYVRCVQTFEPAAAALDLPLQVHDALAEGGDAAPALELIGAIALLGPTALSTHGDIQTQVIEAAGIGEGEQPKGSTWVLDVRAGEIAAGRYVPPPA
jgi:8-oxo-dGTP diphosphatase